MSQASKRTSRSSSRPTSRSRSVSRKTGSSSSMSSRESHVETRKRSLRQREEAVTRVIYKGLDQQSRYFFKIYDISSAVFIFLIQFFLAFYIFIVYILVAMKPADQHDPTYGIMLFAELTGTVVLLYIFFKQTLGCLSLALGIQFMLMYMSFSFFLQFFDEDYKKMIHWSQGLESVSIIEILAAAFHGIILFFLMDLMGTVTLKNEYENEIIVESVDNRKKKLYTMIVELFKGVLFSENDAKIGVVITDETGHPVKLNGSVLKSDLQQLTSMKMTSNSIKVCKTNTAGTSLSVEGLHNANSRTAYYDDAGIPCYNKCSQQTDMMSPKNLIPH